MKRALACSALLFLLNRCATTTPVDMAEPRRVVGTENGVRLDAQISADGVAPGARVPITYEITNQRETPIAVAELLPDTTYDSDSRLFTVSIGSEVPGNAMLPRLILIVPGEKKTFSAAARLIYVVPPRSLDSELRMAPAGLRVKLNFLGDPEPFRALIGIKEVALSDPKLADALFPIWLEKNEAVYTNSIPMRWVARSRDLGDTTERSAPGRRRRGG